MDLLTLIETCSVAKDVPLVLAMTLTFSGGNAYTVEAPEEVDEVDVEESDKSAAPRSREAGLAELRRLLANGVEPVAGLLPATARMAKDLERPVEDLLDPCAGLGIATAKVSEAEFECEGQRRKAQRKDQRLCVLQTYAREAGLEFFADDVLSLIEERGIPAADAPIVLETTTVYEAAVYAEVAAGRTWGADRIFVALDKRPVPAVPPVKPAEPANVKRRATPRLSVAALPPLPRFESPRQKQ
jgi:hypothetical protein